MTTICADVSCSVSGIDRRRIGKQDESFVMISSCGMCVWHMWLVVDCEISTELGCWWLLTKSGTNSLQLRGNRVMFNRSDHFLKARRHPRPTTLYHVRPQVTLYGASIQDKTKETKKGGHRPFSSHHSRINLSSP